ncbi:MAG: tRNA pseudouridine65 synthase [Paraglaciecola sp.]|jgi:tRNA pseudouridine65 synthase
MSLDIIFQDEFMVAIDKPSGLLVHRSPIDRHETRFAVQLLRDQIGQHVFPVHRLDRPTSGVLLFALSADIARLLNQQFARQEITKTYFAIVRGHAPDAGVIDYALKEKLDKIADKMADQNKPAQEAVTSYQTLSRFELPFAVSRYPSARYSLLKLQPKTGRKHQLRRHMAHINHPIVGDTNHGDGKHNKFIREQYGFSGLALTCYSMAILHPITQQQIVLKCEFDASMKSLLNTWGTSSNDLFDVELS